MRQTEFDELLALLDAGGYHLKETDLNPMAEPDAKATSTQEPPTGTRGTVIGVDDTGSIMVNWDNGSGLNIIYGVDRCRKVSTND